jgi:hypothetical protein
LHKLASVRTALLKCKANLPIFHHTSATVMNSNAHNTLCGGEWTCICYWQW